jgi:hypothetical protein
LAAQGIEAESPQQSAKRFARTWSGKPGFLSGRLFYNLPDKKGAQKKNFLTGFYVFCLTGEKILYIMSIVISNK